MTGQGWDGLLPRQQWLSLVLAALEDRSSKGSFLTSDTVALDALRALLARESEELLRTKPPSRFARQAPHFFQQHYKPVLQQTPLSEWGALLNAIKEDVAPLSARELGSLRKLSGHWADLYQDTDRRRRFEAVEVFARFLVRSLSWKYVRRIELGNVQVHAVNLSVAALSLPPIVPIIITFVDRKNNAVRRAVEYTLNLQRAMESLDQGGRELIINVVVCHPGHVSGYAEELAGERNFLPLFEEDLKTIFLSERYTEGAQKWIQRNIGLSRLNPYTTEKPVHRPDMFFGRADEANVVLDNPGRDFMIVGCRQIGKSSLLHYLKRTTEASNSRHPILLDCARIKDPQEFAVRLTERINPRRLRHMSLARLPQMVRANQSATGRRYLLLLDESDGLVSMASQSGDWRVFEVLRELSNEGLTQTVFAGYKALYEAWKNLASPLYNFVSPIYLATLSEHSARELARRPMSRLGVTYGSKNLVSQLVRETGGHPSFLQFLCAGLIRALDKNGERRIEARHVNSLRTDRVYQDLVLRPFQARENLSRLERLLILEIVYARETKVTVHDFEALAAGMGGIKTREILDALQSLEIAGFLRATQSKVVSDEDAAEVIYVWTVPSFPVIAERNLPVQREVRELREELGLARRGG